MSVLFFRADKEEGIDLGCPITETTSLSMVLLGIEGSVGYINRPSLQGAYQSMGHSLRKPAG